MMPKQVMTDIFERFLQRPMPAMLTSEIIKKLDAAGYAIVPKEPTDKMLEAQFGKFGPRECYVAMIDAANT